MSELKLVPLPVAGSEVWKKFGFKINDSSVILDKKKFPAGRVKIQLLTVETHQI